MPGSGGGRQCPPGSQSQMARNRALWPVQLLDAMLGSCTWVLWCMQLKKTSSSAHIHSLSKIFDFSTDQRRPPDMSNSDILLAKFPKGRKDDECTLLLGSHVELVHQEVVLKQTKCILVCGTRCKHQEGNLHLQIYGDKGEL